MTQIKYRDISGNELTEQDVKISDSYSIEEYVNGRLKRVDIYYNGQRDGGEYYLDKNEDINTFLTEIQGIWDTADICTDIQTSGSYTIRNWEIYKGKTKILYGKTAYDDLNREIACQRIDPVTSNVFKITKRYYIPNTSAYSNEDGVPDFGSLEFIYNVKSIESGNIVVLINLPGFDHKEYYINAEKNILMESSVAKFFIWAEHPYYHNDQPFIPLS